FSPALSPDGQQVAVHRTVQGVPNIWVIDALHTNKFTFDPAGDLFPLWSPNGAQIAFSSNRQGKIAEWVKSASGAGAEDLLADGRFPSASLGMSDWPRDGKYILVDKSPADIWVIPVGVKGKPFLFIDGTPTAERVARFSPNGKWVAYQSNETGRAEI